MERAREVAVEHSDMTRAYQPLQVLKYPPRKYGQKIRQTVLTRPGQPITQFGPSLHQLCFQMFSTIAQSETRGLGLAAPQVGFGLNVFVIDTRQGPQKLPTEAERLLALHTPVLSPSADPAPDQGAILIVCNPVLVEFSKEMVAGMEGCLSLPGQSLKIARARQVYVRAQNSHGEWFEFEASDLDARVVQHEADHLNGQCILDHRSVSKKVKKNILGQIQVWHSRGKW